MAMKRDNSSSSLLLLDPDLDSSDDVFDPPAWRPGRFLQFADISLEDEPSVRPVSLPTERAVPGLGDSADGHSHNQATNSFVVQVGLGGLLLLLSFIHLSSVSVCLSVYLLLLLLPSLSLHTILSLFTPRTHARTHALTHTHTSASLSPGFRNCAPPGVSFVGMILLWRDSLQNRIWEGGVCVCVGGGVITH